MPSVLGRIKALANGGERGFRPTRLKLRNPWGGYIPDVAAHERSPNSVEFVENMLVVDGVLTTEPGWEKVDSARLPLGHNGDALAFTDAGANTYGAGGTAVTTGGNDVVQPVVHLTDFQRYTASAGLGTSDVFAITADTGTVGTGSPPYQETGHLFQLAPSGQWTSREFTSFDGITSGSAKAASAVPLTGTATDFVDSTVYTPGVTGANDTAGNARKVLGVSESVLVWCNGRDEVMYYPSETGATTYTDFRTYAKQLDNYRTGATFSTTVPFQSFKASSLATYRGRVFYFNTVEGGTYYGNRLRWGIVGNPFVVWSNFEISKTVGSFVGTGAGVLDLDQFRTDGQRCMVNGDVLVCYSKDGIAHIYGSNLLQGRIEVEYITLERGLVAKGGLCNLGSGVHFAILSDGWYFVVADGSLEELGALDQSPLATQGQGATRRPTSDRIYKWKRDFYGRLDRNNLSKLKTVFSPDEKLVRITAPMQGGTETWIYEIENDRVFLSDYTSVNNQDQSATAWSRGNRLLSTATIWSAATGTWTSYTGRTWDSFRASSGDRATFHGDSGGYVYVHDTALSTRDGTTVNWEIETAAHAWEAFPSQKVAERLWAQYRNNSAECSQMTVEVASDQRTQTGQVMLDDLSPGQLAVGYEDFRVPGQHHQVRLAGTGRPLIHALELEILADDVTYTRTEGS